VEALKFSDPHAAEIINAWAGEKTQGKIKRMADGMIDREGTRLFLADAIYFKGKWSKPFVVKDTKDRPFHLHAGAEKRIPMMLESTRLEYREGPGYQAVRLPYSGERLAMYVFLPASKPKSSCSWGLCLIQQPMDEQHCCDRPDTSPGRSVRETMEGEASRGVL
jgi:serine protease inhibitor